MISYRKRLVRGRLSFGDGHKPNRWPLLVYNRAARNGYGC